MAGLEIPITVGFSSKVFNIGHYQQINPSGDVGFIQTINRTSPAWFAEYSTPPLHGDVLNEAKAFLDQLEGSMNTFLAYDPRRVLPYAYLNQPYLSTPWGVSPRITAQNYTNSTISLDQLTVGAILSKGDYVSVLHGGAWYLYRMVSGAVADGSGVATVTVKPRPNIPSLTTTVIRYHRACIEMKLIGDYEESDSVDSLPVLSFRAAQFTRRAPI